MTLSQDAVDAIRTGYTFGTSAIELGVLINDEPQPEVGIRIALPMLNRHGLIAGATGTGKTKTLQVFAEQLSRAGVPVFAADIKGDLSGLAVPGASSEKLLARTQAIGQDWQPRGCPVEFYALGGEGAGIPLRATVTAFGPLLLSKVLGLNDVQESSLALVFHYADQAGLPLLDLKDLTELLKFLTSDDGKEELDEIGGVSKATVGVILRQISALMAQGADKFFGEPEFDTNDLLHVTPDGQGVISLLELPNLQNRPALFSTFLMWLLADLFFDLPEVGDIDKPKLVFFFDEAHLLFNGASKAFLEQVEQTVRLIRSKGVGIFFVTQSPNDIPDGVLAQLGSRVQHQLRAHTPRDAKALKATVDTYPISDYDLEEVLTTLGIGEAAVTVLNPNGAPTPVAWTRIFAPTSSMDPLPTDMMARGVQSSQLYARYSQTIDRYSAYEMLRADLEAGAQAAQAEAQQQAQAAANQQTQAAQAEAWRRAEARALAEAAALKAQRESRYYGSQRRYDDPYYRYDDRYDYDNRRRSSRTSSRREERSMVEEFVTNPLMRQVARTAAREITRELFGTARRRRRR